MSEQSVVLVSRQRDQLEWLQTSLEGTASVVICEQTELNDVLQLLNMAAASILFMPLRRDTWVEDVQFIEGLMAARPTLACIALSDSLDQERLLAAMRAGVKDFLTFSARPSELAGLVRRLAERTPAVVAPPMQQGKLIALASERPVMHSAFHALHLGAMLRQTHPDATVLLVDIGLPFAEAHQLYGLEGHFSFIDALRNLRRLDSSLIKSSVSAHKSGVRVLSAAQEGMDFSEITTSEMFLLVGTLRSLKTHVIFNLCGLPTNDLTELIIGNADHVVFPVDQSITSCRNGLGFVSRLRELGVPINGPMLLIDNYQARISPDSKTIARSFGMEHYVELSASSELRLRAMNVGQLVPELAPQDALSRQYRQWASLVDAPAGGPAAAAQASPVDRLMAMLKGR